MTGQDIICTAVQSLWKISWQAGALAVVILVIARLAAKAPASLRHALWIIVLIKFFVPPFAHFPHSWAFWQHTGSSINSTVEMPSAPPDPAAALPFAAVKPDVLVISAETVLPQHPSKSVDWQALLFIGWSVGAVSMAILLLVRTKRQSRLLKNSPAAGEDLTRILMDGAIKLGGCYVPQVKLSDNCATPMLVGVFRPTILLPPRILESCTQPDLCAMLMHELAHIKRRDMVSLWLHQIVRVVFFFHPAVWLAGCELRRERELACDELVLSTSTITSHDYASGYMSALKLANKMPDVSTSLAMAEPFEVEKRRLTLIFRNPVPRLSMGWGALLFTVVAIGLPTIAGVARSFDNDAGGPDGMQMMSGWSPVIPWVNDSESSDSPDPAEVWKQQSHTDAQAQSAPSSLPSTPEEKTIPNPSGPQAPVVQIAGKPAPQQHISPLNALAAGDTPEPFKEVTGAKELRPDFVEPHRVTREPYVETGMPKSGILVDDIRVTNNGRTVFYENFENGDTGDWSPIKDAAVYYVHSQPRGRSLHLCWRGGSVSDAFHRLSIDDPGAVQISARVWLPSVQGQYNWHRNSISFTNLVLYSGNTNNNICVSVRLHPGEDGYRINLHWNDFTSPEGSHDQMTDGSVLEPGKWARISLHLNSVEGKATASLNNRPMVSMDYNPENFTSIDRMSIWGWLGEGESDR